VELPRGGAEQGFFREENEQKKQETREEIGIWGNNSRYQRKVLEQGEGGSPKIGGKGWAGRQRRTKERETRQGEQNWVKRRGTKSKTWKMSD